MTKIEGTVGKYSWSVGFESRRTLWDKEGPDVVIAKVECTSGDVAGIYCDQFGGSITGAILWAIGTCVTYQDMDAAKEADIAKD